MKKIIVLGMFLIFWVFQVLPSDENPWATLIFAGITFAGLKVGAEKLNEYSRKRLLTDFIQKSSAGCISYDKDSSESSVASDVSSECQSVSDINPYNFDHEKPRSLRGLKDAKREALYIPDSNSPSSIMDIDEINKNSLVDAISTTVPFACKSAIKLKCHPVVPVQVEKVSPITRPLSPDDYCQVTSSPKFPLYKGNLIDQDYEIINRDK
jgi:hypothetical protein